ncbi:MAG: phosphoglucosamine mutase [Pirellulales bacterium]
MSEPIISVSGLRGLLGSQLTPAVAGRYVAALASTLPQGSVVVSRDGRAGGEMLAQAVSATLTGHGMNVIDIGVAATPTTGVYVRHVAAAAGIQISASHNPREYNGLKLFAPDGRVLTKTAGERVLAAYRAGDAAWVGVDAIGNFKVDGDPHDQHLNLVLDLVDESEIMARQFRVLLDSNNGAGSILGARLLSELACQTVVLGADCNGNFLHTPEPLASNLDAVCRATADGRFDIGFCQDPDADRLAIIDEQGNYIGEELTLALCLMSILPNRPGPIVTNCATSSLARHLAAEYRVPFSQSAVGEANVVDEMLRVGAIFGGEGNGGPIEPRVGYVRDSFVGMALVLDLMARTGLRLSELVAQLPPLAMVKDKIELPGERLPALLDKLVSEMAAHSVSRLDGLRLDWSDRWLLVRGSNTEPIVRLIAEAPSVAEAQALCDRARRLAT